MIEKWKNSKKNDGEILEIAKAQNADCKEKRKQRRREWISVEVCRELEEKDKILIEY